MRTIKVTALAITMLFGGLNLLQAQYIDLPENIDWLGTNVATGSTNADSVEKAFNNARTIENTALSTNIPMINFPDNVVWSKMSPNAQAFWIVNQERTARGIMPLEDTAQALINVAQDYTNFLIDNDTTGHYADDGTPETRIRVEPTCDECMTQWGENIGYIFSGYPNAPSNSIERMIYWLIYEDAIANWGHRKLFFKQDFVDDSGETGKEGIMGMGFVISDQYKTYNYSAITVFNIIDPCSTWEFPEPVIIQAISDINTPQVSVLPSIAKTTVSVSDENIAAVSFYNTSGVNTLTVTDSFNNIHISSLSVGTYIVIVTYNDGQLAQSKIQLIE